MNNTVCTTTNITKCIVDKHDGNGGSSGHFGLSFDGCKAKNFCYSNWYFRKRSKCAILIKFMVNYINSSLPSHKDLLPP